MIKIINKCLFFVGTKVSQWNSPKNQPKGNAPTNWQPQMQPATTAPSYRPMMGQQPVMGQQPMMAQPMMGQPMIGQPMMPNQQGMMMQPMMGGAQPQFQQFMGSPKMGTSAQPQQPKQEVTFDPFGAL